MRPRRNRSAALLVIAVAVAACSTGDGRDIGAGPDPTFVVGGAAATGDASAPSAPSTLPGETPETVVDTAAGSSGDTAPSASDVPEVGVPGLDADDAFCAAWSRFAGSFQVIAVKAAFGDDSPASVAEAEVIAGSTVTAAHADLGELWPAELAAERDLALNDSLGPFARRVGAAADLLAAAGTTAEQLDAIEAAWLAALAARDPNDPEPVIELDDESWSIVRAVAADHLARSGSWSDDTSLVTETETPLTDVYLIENCPDRGTLAGQDAAG